MTRVYILLSSFLNLFKTHLNSIYGGFVNYVEYAKMFIGKPYIWGGAGAVGFDCSGLVIECLQAFGLLPSGDWTADELSKKLKSNGWTEVKDYKEGDIVFFHYGTKYYHVAMMVNDCQYIEAGGCNSKCTNASNSTGLVRIRPLTWRKPSLILRKV